MGVGDTIRKLIGLDDAVDDITEEEIEKEKEALKTEERKSVSSFRPQGQFEPQAPKLSSQKNISFNGTSAFKLVVIEPKRFEECPKLVDSLRGRRPIIINLEKIETETAKKIFDFLSGATYALNGNVQKVANNIFIFAPESVDISASQDERGFDFSQKSSSPWK